MMFKFKFKSSIIVLMVITLCQVVQITVAVESIWKWTCKNDLCLRQENCAGEYLSIEMCRLVCGNKGPLWPIPTGQFNKTNTLFKVHPSRFEFDVHAPAKTTHLLKRVAAIFKKNLFSDCPGDCTSTNEEIVKVDVTVESDNIDLSWDTDESYSIKTQDRIWYINAATFYGARHAIETLSQLVAPYPDGLVMIQGANIKDKPFYPHRSLLLDTSRNYMSVNAIKRQLDGMAASKLNYFHWHITDSQSFPYVSTRVPNLSKYGAYSSAHIYSPTDINELIHYALERGIRIIMEIDSPAHAGNGWQWGPQENLGNLAVCVNQQPWRSYCIEAPCGQLNPANQNVYDVLELLYHDIIDQFPQNDLFHMGADEIFFACWNSSQEIIDYLKSQNKSQTKDDFLDLWSEFHAKALARYDKLMGHSSSTILLWSSDLTDPNVIEKYLDKSRYVIETWVPSTDPLPNELLSKGYRLIVSTKNAWYLDHGFWGSTKYYGWRTVYNNKLVTHKNVLGGEICMWSEYLDEEALDGRVWPRAAAAAERLWANPPCNSYEAERRMYAQRERLVRRGIDAEALTPHWCYQNEGQCT